MKKTLVIIGGGAAGLMAACAAGRAALTTVRIIIVEARDRVGKKILATGNGRCNLTNLRMSSEYYHAMSCVAEPHPFVVPALACFDTETVMDFFSSIGLLCRMESGRVYPYCNQASAVLDVLRNEAACLGVETVIDFAADSVVVDGKGFRIASGSRVIAATSIIVATGGCASPTLGSDGSGFKLLSQMGHRITALYPGLVQLKTNNTVVKGLKGIRFFGTVTLFTSQQPCRHIATAEGEMLFTEYGLSGIPVMEVSSYVRHMPLDAVIDFLPAYDPKRLSAYMEQRAESLSHLHMEDFLTGLLPKKLGQAIVKMSGIEKLSLPVRALTGEQIALIANLLKNMTLPITGTNGFANAQITVGGADSSQFSPHTMESKIVKGLYVAGEVLDVNGDCGGYNLHWAWASGHIAGRSAIGLQKQ